MDPENSAPNATSPTEPCGLEGVYLECSASGWHFNFHRATSKRVVMPPWVCDEQIFDGDTAVGEPAFVAVHNLGEGILERSQGHGPISYIAVAGVSAAIFSEWMSHLGLDLPLLQDTEHGCSTNAG